jgi:NAD(P)-dependent dehydrogenase (short-subunit alcohol dehydrogenase family)
VDDTVPRSGPLAGQVALVAGGTRGATKAIAVELGRAGATVHVTGRSVRGAPSPMARPETVEDTAEEIVGFGGVAQAHRVDHSDPAAVRVLVEEIADRHEGRLDVLVNGIWGGDPLSDWEHPFWEQPVETGLALLRQAVHTHLITAVAAAPLLVANGHGLVLELTDGKAGDPYRGTLYYDLAKDQVTRLALGMAGDLRPHGVAALALAPGFLRSEAMLDRFGVTEVTWREGIAHDPLFAVSESPVLVARCAVALACDPDVIDRSGESVASWDLAREYDVVDADGSRPDWGGFYAAWAAGEHPDPADYRSPPDPGAAAQALH